MTDTDDPSPDIRAPLDPRTGRLSTTIPPFSPG